MPSAAGSWSAPERVDGVAELRASWPDPAGTSGGVFASWEWLDAWARHLGDGHDEVVHVVRDRGDVVCVLPLVAWRARRPRVLRFLGHGPADALGPVCRVDDEPLARQALAQALDAEQYDVALLEQLPGGRSWETMSDTQPWRVEASPVIEVPEGGWLGYLDARTSSFRQQLRRKRRLLAAAGTVRYRLADASTLDRDLDALFALHRARWGGRPTDFSDGPFHREVARRALERGWLRLWTLELDGTPVAAWHGFHLGRATHYYQAGRDPAFDRLSVGFLVLAHSLEQALGEGAQVYRLGRGDEAFKRRLADRDPGLTSLVRVMTPLGAVSARCAQAVRRARSALR